MAVWTPLIITCALAIISAVLGFALYRVSVAAVEQRNVRLSGALLISIVAYLGMSRLYLSLSNQQLAGRSELEHQVHSAQREYDDCRQHEKAGFACMEPADRLRETCNALLAR